MTSNNPGGKDSSSAAKNANSNSSCVLCGVTCCGSVDDGDDDVIAEEETHCKAIALKMWFRYLKVNVSKVLEERCSPELRGNQGGGGGGGPLSDLEWGKVLVSQKKVCNECFALANKFWVAYQDFEVIRLLIEECVENMRQRLEQHGGGIPTPTPTTQCSREDAFKVEVFKKCTQRLRSMPKVTLDDIQSFEQKHVTGQCISDHEQGNKFARIPSFRDEVSHLSSQSAPVFDDIQSLEQENVSEGGGMGSNAQGNNSSRIHNIQEEVVLLLQPTTYPVSQLGSASTGTFSHPIKTEFSLCGKPCRICGKCFSSGRRLRIHMLTHNIKTTTTTTNSLTSLVCPQCNLASANAREYQYHVMGNHPYEFFHQEFSKTTKNNLESLIQQLLMNSEKIKVSGEEYFKCSKCPTLLPSALEWRLHLFGHHLTTVVDLIENDKSIITINDNQNQQQDRTPLQDSNTQHKNKNQNPAVSSRKELTCQFCGITFKGRQMFTIRRSYRTHLRMTHPYSFYSTRLPPSSTESSVKAELSSIYKEIRGIGTGEHQACFKCPFCTSTYSSRFKCKIHIAWIHENIILERLKSNVMMPSLSSRGETPIQVPVGQFQCKYCEKVFLSLTIHRQHMQGVHTLEYLLTKVPTGTSRKSVEIVLLELNKSIVTKSILLGESRFHCPFCSSAFKTRYRTKRHIVALHFDVLLSRGGCPPSAPPQKAPPQSLPNQKVCHCGVIFQEDRALKFHRVTQHPYIVFAKDYEHITTEDEFLKVLEAMLNNCALNDDKNRFQCLVCDTIFTRRKGLKYHLLQQGHFKEVLISNPPMEISPRNDYHITPVVPPDGVENDVLSNQHQIEVNMPSLINLEGQNGALLSTGEMEFDEGTQEEDLEEDVINFEHFASTNGFEDESLEQDPLSIVDTEMQMDIVSEQQPQQPYNPSPSRNAGMCVTACVCAVCNQICTNATELSRHLLACHLVEAFFQNVLNPPFTTEPLLRQTLENQIRRVVDNDEGTTKVTLECVHCQKRMSNPNSIWMLGHMRDVHLNEIIKALELHHQAHQAPVISQQDSSRSFDLQDLPANALLIIPENAMEALATQHFQRFPQ